MGTTGSGKTTIGRLLAAHLGWEFADPDDFHSPANVAKMSRAIALDDADRAAWLDALRAVIERWIAESQNAVMACSALKTSYREYLRVRPPVRFIYLKGSYETIAQRIQARKPTMRPRNSSPASLPPWRSQAMTPSPWISSRRRKSSSRKC